MALLKKICAIYLVIAVCLSAAGVNAAVNMIGPGSQNEGMYAVPAPGEVTIDGDLSEWDLSGRISMFADKDIRDTFTGDVSTMYDEKNYYLAFMVKDPTPMFNKMDPVKESLWTWKGDSIQLRFVTDQTIWTTLAYFNDESKSSIEFDYWNNGDDQTQGMDRIIYVSEPEKKELDTAIVIDKAPKVYKGLEQKFKKLEDGTGYIQEVKIPWEYLYKGGMPSFGGDNKFKMGIEMYWGDATGTVYHEYKYFDNMAPGKTQREFFYKAKDVWGYVTLSPKGNMKPREYIPDAKVTGSIKIKLDVPKDAKYLTIVADNDKGERIRNVASELNVDEYVTEEHENTKTVCYGWDGLDNFGKMIKPGTYTIKGITHQGIEPVYDTVFYNPGTPPWPTIDGTGDWGSDHSSPISTTSYGDMTYIGWGMAEGGHALIGIGADGRKKWGENRGARIMAANEKYLFSIPDGGFYVPTAGATGDSYIMRLDRQNGNFLPFVLDGKERKFELSLSTALEISNYIIPNVTGMAADKDHLFIATAENNNFESITGGKNLQMLSCINVLDSESGVLEKRIKVPNIGGIALSKDGRLYAVSGGNICEVNISSGLISKLNIDGGKDFQPGAIAIDLDGNIAVFDKGEDSQVKVFSPNGAMLYTAGKKGGRPLVGDFDKQAMIKVSSITVDYKGNIWAVENWDYPRRVSVWGKDGRLVRDYIGNTAYCAGGAFLHDQDPTKAYVGPVEIKLDRENKSWEVTKILWVPDEQKGESFPLDHLSNVTIQHFYSNASGKKIEYIFDPSYGNLTGEADVLYMEKPDGTFKPVFAMGPIGSLYSREILSANTILSSKGKGNDDPGKAFAGLNALSKQQIFLWNDLSGDGKVQFDECEFFIDPHVKDYYPNAVPYSNPIYNGWGCRMTSDLRFVNTNNLKQGCIFKPEYFTKEGAPVYTKKSMKWLDSERKLFLTENVLIDGTNQVLSVAGEYIEEDRYQDGIKVVDYDKNSKELWYYNNDNPGVSGSHTATMQTPGTVIGPIKMMGIVDISDNQKLFALRGNLGCDYLITTDGYYVQTLFKDGRLPRSTLPASEAEAQDNSMKNLTEGSEPFSGWFGKQDDGGYRMVVSVGGRSAVVAKLKGLEIIKKFEPVKLPVTIKDIQNAEVFNAKAAKQPESSGETVGTASTVKEEYKIAHADKPFAIDGDLSDWADIGGLSIAKTGAVEKGTAKLSWDDSNLYAAFAISDETPMANKGKDYTKLFKTGDAVDIQLSPSGNTNKESAENDMRIVISKLNGNPVATLMKPIDKTAGADKAITYSSPVMTRKFNRVEILENAEINIKTEGKTYVVEAKIPLADIGMQVNEDMLISGDIGIITSDSMGSINTGRIYYYNKATELTSDMPSEAILNPDKWGKMKFIIK